MQQILKSGCGVIRRNGRLAFLFALSLMLSCCSDSPTQPTRAPRNTFSDYQHISGYVSGVWTREHNPYVITGDVFVKDGDSLIFGSGTTVIMKATITVESGILIVAGTYLDPVRLVHNSAIMGGGIYCSRGLIRMAYGVFEGNGKSISSGLNLRLCHMVFSETLLDIADFYQGDADSVIVQNCIFAGYRPWASSKVDVQFRTFEGNNVVSYLNSGAAKISNNLFYPGIGDSSWVDSPYNIVDVRLIGNAGIQHIQGCQWPGNGNLFGDPKWVKYNFVGPSPAGISDNDYHLQPGSPAIGAASDGTNIGAY